MYSRFALNIEGSLPLEGEHRVRPYESVWDGILEHLSWLKLNLEGSWLHEGNHKGCPYNSVGNGVLERRTTPFPVTRDF